MISQYDFNGVYQIDLPLFTEEQYSAMKEVMGNTFRTKNWIVEQFRHLFPNSNILSVNAESMKKIGYKLHAVKCKIKCANYCSEKVTISCSGWGIFLPPPFFQF